MDTNLALKLREITIETFEKYCSLFPAMDGAGGSGESGQKESAASVDFYGPFKGTLGISVQEGTLKEIAKTMVGEQEKYTPQEELDAVGEIANVICGNILPYVADPHSHFKIDSPRALEKSKLGEKTLLARSEVRMENGKVEVVLYRSA